MLTCVNEVCVHVRPGRADAPGAAVGVGQAEVRRAEVAGSLRLGGPTAGEGECQVIMAQYLK